MPINCYFQDSKALLDANLAHCKKRYNKYGTFTFNRLPFTLTALATQVSNLLNVLQLLRSLNTRFTR